MNSLKTHKSTLYLAAGASLALLIGSTGCAPLKARDQLNQGVRAFKVAKYAEAVEHFRTATELDPKLPAARLYLATAYYSQYIPGAESPENMELAKNAYEEYLKVLEQEPGNELALASIASLYFHQKKWPEAEEWYGKLIAANPNNKEGLYTMGVIAWTKSFQKRMEARAKLGMKPEDPGPLKDKKIREPLAAELMPIINKGIENLEKALQVDNEYDDSMAYMNLLLRERADLQDSPEAYKKDIETADGWVSKTMDTKKIKLERSAKTTGGIVQE
ncbi:MAG: tetratricopeptide repeat protein [Bryobacteraceae bacterium]